ncbi:hypothetical protein, partial [Hoyosella altamirensis]
MNLSETQIRRIVDELADEVVNRLLELEAASSGPEGPRNDPERAENNPERLHDQVFIDGEWVDRVPGEQYAQDSAYAAAGNAA